MPLIVNVLNVYSLAVSVGESDHSHGRIHLSNLLEPLVAGATRLHKENINFRELRQVFENKHTFRGFMSLTVRRKENNGKRIRLGIKLGEKEQLTSRPQQW